MTIEIPTGNGGKWRISNVYIPSERAGDCRGSVAGETGVSTTYWPCTAGDLIAGDLNAHNIIWDPVLEDEERRLELSRGRLLEQWMEENHMTVLNSGTETTHTNRKTGTESTPDVAIVHESQLDMYEWEVLEELGGSDHKPRT